MKVFVYATLKSRGIQKEALGHFAVSAGQGWLHGYKEVMVHYHGDDWPTLIRERPPSVNWIPGKLLDVSSNDYARLRAWEDHYIPIDVLIRPWEVQAKTFIVDPTKMGRP